jgi:Fe-Mn family superoxide dismutase
MNKLIKGTPYDKETDLDAMVSKDTMMKADSKLFNNACQAWNHIFYFNGLSPSPGELSDDLAAAIKVDFQSPTKMKDEFIEAATNVFGSGWCWLIVKDNKLSIKTTPNAGNPLSQDRTVPLLCIDVWEHAYLYQEDYAADRTAYLNGIWNVIDWKTISERYADAK